MIKPGLIRKLKTHWKMWPHSREIIKTPDAAEITQTVEDTCKLGIMKSMNYSRVLEWTDYEPKAENKIHNETIQRMPIKIMITKDLSDWW